MVTKKKTTKKKTTKAKKTTVKKEPVAKPTQEEIQKELNAIADAKLAAAGVKKPASQEITIQEAVELGTKIDEAIMDLFKTPSTIYDVGDLQPIMNVLTRMYESSEDDYLNVRYIKEKGTIVVDLDKNIFKDLNKEIERIKTQVCCDTLRYTGVEDVQHNRIMIVIRIK